LPAREQRVLQSLGLVLGQEQLLGLALELGLQLGLQLGQELPLLRPV
jgi:hypothetical protein